MAGEHVVVEEPGDEENHHDADATLDDPVLQCDTNAPLWPVSPQQLQGILHFEGRPPLKKMVYWVAKGYQLQYLCKL